MKMRHWLAVGLTAAVLGGVFATAAADPQRREETSGHIRELQREIDELHRLGRHDRAEQAERELDRLRERSERPQRRERPEAEQIEERIHHLIEAAEHLEAAGLGDAADDVRGEAEALEQELRDRQRPRQQQETAERFKKMAGTMRQVRREVAALREEVADLRHRVEELSERR